MPTYEYVCLKDHKYQEVRGINEEQQRDDCPECGEKLKRIFSAPPITFNGTGFSQKRG